MTGVRAMPASGGGSYRNRYPRSWRWLLAACVLLASDLAAARILVRMYPQVDIPRAERDRLAQLEHDATERQYRVKSGVYDHDLAARFDGLAWWGPLPYRIRTNSLGFKDATTRVVALRSDRPRVLLIGDSITEGLGFEFKETYAGLIAERLQRQGVEVLNAAVTSYSPAIYYAKIRYLLETVGLRFTDVVVFIDISDIEDEARVYDLRADGHITRMVNGKPGRGREYGDEPAEALDATVPVKLPVGSQVIQDRGADDRARAVRVSPASQSRSGVFEGPLTTLKRRSILVRAVAALDDWRSSHDEPMSPAYPRGNPRRGLWTVDERDFQSFGRLGLMLAGRHMQELDRLLRRHGVRLTVAVYPWPDQVRYDRADSVQVSYWHAWAERHDVAFVDLFKPFFLSGDRDATIRAYYIPGDVHFNRKGHRLIADAFRGSPHNRVAKAANGSK